MNNPSTVTWRHVDVTEFGGPDVLSIVEESKLPVPMSGQVLVRVLAVGTGFTDTIIRQGQYVDVKDKPPFTLGYDWVGVVAALGEGVVGLKEGQIVADMPVIGGYTEYLCVDADKVVPAPEGVDPFKAVCMVLSYTTAWQMLKRSCDLNPGDSILVHAAGGAVGTALLELARLKKLKVYGTGSASKKALIERFGATAIDYRSEDFVARLKHLEPDGVKAVFDTIGAQNWSRSYKCLKRGGKLVAFGALQLTTGQETVPQLLWGFAKLMLLWRLLPNGKQSEFYNIHSRRNKLPQEFKEDVSELFDLLAQGKLEPAIEEVRPLSDVVEVHRRIDAGEVLGKIVLDCSPQTGQDLAADDTV